MYKTEKLNVYEVQNEVWSKTYGSKYFFQLPEYDIQFFCEEGYDPVYKMTTGKLNAIVKKTINSQQVTCYHNLPFDEIIVKPDSYEAQIPKNLAEQIVEFTSNHLKIMKICKEKLQMSLNRFNIQIMQRISNSENFFTEGMFSHRLEQCLGTVGNQMLYLQKFQYHLAYAYGNTFQSYMPLILSEKKNPPSNSQA